MKRKTILMHHQSFCLFEDLAEIEFQLSPHHRIEE